MKEPYITGIMACDLDGAIGKNNKLPWHYEEDLAHFRKLTDNNLMIMGHNTFVSMPASAFKTRLGVVFSRTSKHADENIEFVSSLEECMSLIASKYQDKKCFMIGGAQIASLFLQNNLIQEFILTKLKASYEADVFFPLYLLENWSYNIIKEHDDFTIYRYLNENVQ